MLTNRDDTMLGDVPENWEVVTLRDALATHFPGDWGEERGDHLVKVLRSTNLTNDGPLDLSDVAVRAIPSSKADVLAPRKDDILLERSGGGPDQPVGRVGFIEKDMSGFAFSNFLHLLRPDCKKANPRLLGWLLHYANRTGRTLRLEQQTTQMRNLHFRDYLTIRLPKPPDEEASGIASILDAADAAIERTRTAIAKARRVKQALIQAFLADLASNPTRLGKFATDIRYGTSQASNAKGWGYPTLRIPNIIGGRIDVVDLSFVDAPTKDADWLALEPGDLLVVRTNGNPAYVGRSAVFFPPDDRRWLYASYLIRVRFNDEILPRFVDEYLKAEKGRRELLRRVTTSAGNHNINTKSILALPIPVPTDPGQQARFVALADAANAQIQALEKESMVAEKLKRGLMQDLLTGRIRVGQ